MLFALSAQSGAVYTMLSNIWGVVQIRLCFSDIRFLVVFKCYGFLLFTSKLNSGCDAALGAERLAFFSATLLATSVVL